MANFETISDSNLDALCIPLGAAVSAKFRGAFCEAIVNKVDKKIYCRIQLDDKKTVKVKADDIIGVINTNNKVKVNLDNALVSGLVLKIIDSSVYHVVFNDDDTGILRRNQLVLKGDRHYKLSECLDRHPLTNPEQFTKAVINEKRLKDKSDADEEEFDNEEAKSCSQESMTTVSSSKTRFRQQTVASSASVGTGGSSVTVKTSDDVPKPAVNRIKSKKNINIKYSIGSLVIVNKTMSKLGMMGLEKLDKKMQAFIGLIVPLSLFGSEPFAVKPTQCVVKSFRDNNCYVVYKRDIEVIVKRDMLIKHKESDPSTGSYVEKCILFFDAKILPEHWDMDKFLPAADNQSVDDTADSDRAPSKKSSKLKLQSPRTSLSSMDSSSSDNDDGRNADGSEHSNEDDQDAKDEWVARFFGFWEDKGSPINNALEIMGADVDIYRLYELVKEDGGFQKVTSNVRWPFLYHLMKLPHSASDNFQKLQMLYKKYIFPYVDMKKKLGTFEQMRNRSTNDRLVSGIRKARPLLTARERREYQSNIKKTEACSVSSQSACDRLADKATSGDEGCGGDGGGGNSGGGGGTGSVPGDLCHLSQCSSSPRHTAPGLQMDTDNDCKSTTMITSSQSSLFQPGTLVSVTYGDDKIYKAKIISHHCHHDQQRALVVIGGGSGGGGPGPKSPLPTQSSLSQSYSKTLYQPLLSIDSVSNAESTTSTGGNEPMRSDLDSTALYRVHYIGWNNRHDEIIAADRIVAVLSDTGQDSQSACSSSKGSQHMQPSYDQDQSVHRRLSHDHQMIDEPSLPDVNDVNDTNELLPEISDISHEIESLSDSGHTNDVESKLEPVSVCQYDEPMVEKESQRPVNNLSLKRRRSRSACVVEPAHITIKRLPIVPESRIIASLNLYKTGDKMPKRPIRKLLIHKDEKVMGTVGSCKIESDRTITESSSGSKRHSNSTDESEISSKIPKIEAAITVKTDKTQSKIARLRSPSFSNESLSDASTIAFRNADEQSHYYLSVDDDDDCARKEPPKSVTKIGNKRGRKPLHKHDKKLPGSTTRKIREQKFEIAEIESTSSQHSGSGHGKRVTRSLKTVSDQNTVDDNSLQLEEDSQTSQDGSGFQLPPSLLSDSRHSIMTPLAAGTPTSSHKGRRPKPRRKNRNSQSNSSAECAYQDSIGEANNYSFIEHFNQPKMSDNSPIVNSHTRPLGRSFQRLHPSLIPNDLQKLPPEERVKLLESLIRQTHLNFLDTKEKIKYVEKRISEIKTSRANGHSIESDEDKFR